MPGGRDGATGSCAWDAEGQETPGPAMGDTPRVARHARAAGTAGAGAGIPDRGVGRAAAADALTFIGSGR